ncbi:MAG: ABC transporter permease [Blautia sp.]|nr:ABC transporter permease [Blautia sp.]MDY5030361.1 ABC transporter permease [Blautia sp.]
MKSKGSRIGQFCIKYRTVLILVALIIVFTCLNPVFVNGKNVLNMLKRMSYVALTAYGITFILTMGELDMSGGSMAALVGVVLATLLNKGVPLGLALIIVIVMGALGGTLNALINIYGKINAFLVTLATMNIYRGLAMTISNGRTIPIKKEKFAFMFGNGTLFGVIPMPVVIMLIFFVICFLLYHKTKLGYYTKCIGGNVEAAKVAGINVVRYKIIVFTLAGFLAGMAGLILSGLMNGGMSDLGETLSMDAIAASVLGGTAISGGIGSMWGTLGGVLIMGCLNGGMSLLGAQSHHQMLVKGLVIIFAVYLDNVLKDKTVVTKD